MTLTVGADTYATLEQADAYATVRSWSTWLALTDAVKEARLIEAAQYLDNTYRFIGRIADDDQVMSWPRISYTDKEGRCIRVSTTPQAILNAQIEAANLATTSLVTSQTEGDVQSVQAGSVSVTFKDGQQVTEAARMKPIDRMLAGLYTQRLGSKGMIGIVRA